MKIKSFYHPDLCPVVLRRRAAEEVLDLLAGFSELVLTRGHSLIRPFYESDASYRNAIWRLRKQGFVAYRRTGGRNPVLMLTPGGIKRTSPFCGRKEPWPTSWNGRWFLLSYDVPEKDRRYRNVLRQFLESKRMGCLHRSVWITPRDIRADFDDLAKAGGLYAFAFLFDARSVLGRSAQDIVLTAWDVEALERRQRWYIDVYQENLERVRRDPVNRETAMNLLQEELAAFTMVMQDDPLLPRPLWPANYEGEKVWRLHHALGRELVRRFS